MIQSARLKTLIPVMLLALSSHRCIADAPEESNATDKIRKLYEPISQLGCIAVSKDAERKLMTAVDKDGQFSFVQFDKEMYRRIYRDHRDVDSQWQVVPAHFNYYDGGHMMISTASFDPARMFVERKLDEPMRLGNAIQTKGCIWPLIPAMIDQGELVVLDHGYVISVDQLDLKISLNSNYQVLKVTWGEKRNSEAPIASYEFSGYNNERVSLLPTKMTRSFTFNQSASTEVETVHEHYTLKFVRDHDEIDEMLAFKDPSAKYVRKDAATDNVYDADGTFLYNEKEMADEYLAAISNNGPFQIRFVLLLGIAALAIGSIWVLKSKKPAA